MGLSREQMLAEMGITPLWRQRGADGVASVPAAGERVMPVAEPVSGVPVRVSAPAQATEGDESGRGAAPVATLDWDGLTRRVAGCRDCTLCAGRKQAVLGVGDRRPDWLFIGEGPGAEEDARGEPFVGQAGKLLDAMLAALGIARGDGVYIANAVKCRPPGNRTPEADEMAACRPYLLRQIELLQPRVIVLLGKAAAHALLHEEKALATLRGKRFEYGGIAVAVTYHPAYLLRNLPEKAKAWEDLLFARRLLRQAETPEAS
jgi:DNA polymerase